MAVISKSPSTLQQAATNARNLYETHLSQYIADVSSISSASMLPEVPEDPPKA